MPKGVYVKTEKHKELLRKITLKRYSNGEKFGFQKGNNNVMKNLVISGKQSETRKRLFAEGKIVHWAIGKHIIHSGSFKKGNKHPLWKGKNAGYISIHEWINRRLGTPDICEMCGKSGLTGRKIHWANKDHKYKRNKKDWIRLCISCHKKYDAKTFIANSPAIS